MALKSYFFIGITFLSLLTGLNTVRASQISSERLGFDTNRKESTFYTPFTKFASENSTINATEQNIAVPIPLSTIILIPIGFVGLVISWQQKKNY